MENWIMRKEIIDNEKAWKAESFIMWFQFCKCTIEQQWYTYKIKITYFKALFSAKVIFEVICVGILKYFGRRMV